MPNINKPRLFVPSVIRHMSNGHSVVMRKDGRETIDSNIGSTGSFRYDAPGSGLKSSQQLGVDFSKFEHHTFFNSAVVNVNIAYDKIIQEYPFDGTNQEVEQFFDELTGFEKYVYDCFPKNTGYLMFSGSSGAGGTSISVADYAGASIPSLSKTRSGASVIDPGVQSFSMEMHVFPASASNECQVIAQKLTGSDYNFGFTLALSQSASPNSCSIFFIVSSGTQQLVSSASILKGRFSHVCAVMNRRPGVNKSQIFINERLQAVSTGYSEMGDFGFSGSPLLIASGTSQKISNTSPTWFIPQQTFSGALDEFRFFHGVRTVEAQKSYGRRTIYASPELRLNLKFNEPTGSIGNDNIALDSSGNSLHATITGYSAELRSTGSIACPMTAERMEECPVLFPNYSGVSTFKSILLTSASKYDSDNPNLITRLVPAHYFNMGAYAQGFETDEGDIAEDFTGGGLPRTNRLGSTQLMTAFLYTYAKYFDELKIMFDAFSNVISVDYDEETSTPDQFLTLAAKFRGFDLPNIFGNATIEQQIFGENITSSVSVSDSSLTTVQNKIWRRILTNLGDILRSKGTLHSVKAMIRSIGINPDSSMRIREYGGPTKQALSNAREKRTEVAALMDFSGTMSPFTSTDAQGFSTTHPYVLSAFLSGARKEVGFPFSRGLMVNPSPTAIHGISSDPSDGLFTSGSWTYEAIYRFPSVLTGTHAATQSLVRLCSTGSNSAGHNVLANVVLFSSESGGDEFDRLRLYCRPSNSAGAELLQLELTGVNIFDGDIWNVSFGRRRSDAARSASSSSYFLRAGRQNFGTIQELHTTSTYFCEAPDHANNIFQNITASHNSSGTFIVIGSQSLNNTSGIFLTDISGISDSNARATSFTGKLGQVRFWSKDLRIDEWSEHVRNFKSLGVIDPKLNFNFGYRSTGSFERLRLDMSIDQALTTSQSDGTVILQDFSQGGFNGTASGFESSVPVIKPETFYYSFISSKFDEASTTEKVRVRGYSDPVIDRSFSGSVSPVYEIDRSELPLDDPRLTIDISAVAALDEDIINIFATLRELDNALGNPELQFSPDYPALENLRFIYFERLTNKINLKSFFEFFKWFDSSMGIFIERLLPRKTKFMGINYVIESHMLERAKFEHRGSDAYLGESNRSATQSSILLQQIAGSVTRY